ncbi:MAG: Gfo/Idh/MocA family oxidoreductase [Anaerolineae bacterium]|nr:Gfo/Idh/MocA family oxidoreductase [Anaerolineae bacterium]
MNHVPIRVGVVGGGVGHLHLHGYQALGKEVEIVALCDINEERLTELGNQFSIPLRYTDAEALFTSGEVQAVSICVPNNLHAPTALAALEAGLHVLCEKPLAENVASAQKIVEAAAKATTKFMICFNRRYRRDVWWIKQLLAKNRLGKIYQIKAGWLRETGIPGGWFSNKDMAGGGPLIDLGVHMLDSVMWLLDYPPPLTVSASVQANFGPCHAKTWLSRRPPQGAFNVEDSAIAFIRLADKMTFTLETSWASHARPGLDDFFITLMGTEGAVELYVANYASENTLTWYFEEVGVPVLTRPAVKGARSDHDYAVAEFIKCIKEDTPPTATAEQGLVIMKIIEAVYQSAEQGREVPLT